MTDDREGPKSEIAFKLLHICNVMLGVCFARKQRNVTGTCWAANFVDPDTRHLSIFGLEP